MKKIKRIFATAVTVFAIVALQSCSNGSKICGAYAKHDAGDRPDYHEVQ